MTEPSSGTPSPLPAEPAEPAETDPAIAPDEALEADLEENGRDEDAGEFDEDEDETEAEEQEGLESEPSVGETTVPGVAARPGGAAARRQAGAPTVAPRVPTQSELAVRVTDNQSKVFVIATVVVFVAILAFGVFAGNGGILTPRATPAPTSSASAAPSPSVAPSVSAGTSASPAASASPAPSASPSVAPSASPS